MKRLLFLLLLLCVAASITDQLDADFATGTTSNTNVTNNSVTLLATSGNYSLSGTYTSAVKDLGSNPVATISWTYTSPSGTSVLVSSRSGNTSSPDGTWSSWSSSYLSNSGSVIAGTNRYHQYRLQLATTNQSITPAVQSVTLVYTEQGARITAATSQNGVLNSDTSGTYRFSVLVNDTVALTSVQASTRIGTDAYPAFAAMSQSGIYYYIDTAAPSGNWTTRAGELLYIQVLANNTNGVSANTTFTDLIDDVNHAPVLAAIANTTATERQLKTLSLSATDPDSDNLTFTSTHGTVTSTGTTTGTLSWTPSNSETGLVNVTITVSDGSLTDNQVIAVNVTAVNDPPIMRAVTSQTGHYGDRITFSVIVDDNDTNDNLTFWVVPDLFAVTLVNSSATVYTALANFTALDDTIGYTELVFYAMDTQNTTSYNATLNISYCGDGTCQTQENETSCRADCYAPETKELIALEIPDRLCINETITVQAYNASTRYECYKDGRTYDYKAYCEEQDGISIQIYELNGSLRIDKGSASSNASGHASFTLQNPARYKLVATKEGLTSAEQIITVRNCSEDINLVEQIISLPKPNIIVEERHVEISPDLEKPALIDQPTTLLSIIIWWIVIPLMCTMLLFTGTFYYTTYQDTDPRILALRIKLWEYRSKFEPIVLPYARKIWQIVSPALVPLGWMLWNYGGKQAWKKIFPYLKKLDRRPR